MSICSGVNVWWESSICYSLRQAQLFTMEQLTTLSIGLPFQDTHFSYNMASEGKPTPLAGAYQKSTCSEPGGRGNWLYGVQCNTDFFLPSNIHSLFSLIIELLHFSQVQGWCEWRLHFPCTPAARCGHMTKLRPMGMKMREAVLLLSHPFEVW